MSTSTRPTPRLDAIVEKVKAIANKGKRVTDADLYEIAESPSWASS